MNESEVRDLLNYDRSHLRVAAPEALAARAVQSRRRRRLTIASVSLLAIAAVGGTGGVLSLPGGPTDSVLETAGSPHATTHPTSETDADFLTGQAAMACRQELERHGIRVPFDDAVTVKPQPGGWLVTALETRDSSTNRSPGGWECDVHPFPASAASPSGDLRVLVKEVRPATDAPAFALDGHGTVACRAVEAGLIALEGAGDGVEGGRAVADALAAARDHAALSSTPGIGPASRHLEAGADGLGAFYDYCLEQGWGGNESLSR